MWFVFCWACYAQPYLTHANSLGIRSWPSGIYTESIGSRSSADTCDVASACASRWMKFVGRAGAGAGPAPACCSPLPADRVCRPAAAFALASAPTSCASTAPVRLLAPAGVVAAAAVAESSSGIAASGTSMGWLWTFAAAASCCALLPLAWPAAADSTDCRPVMTPSSLDS
jgi:hypothetical protein